MRNSPPEFFLGEFFSLGEEFVSLGQDEDYYKNLNKTFEKSLSSVLYSLRDAAFFTEISEEFENTNVFKQSLTRDDEAERIHRTAKPMIYGSDLNNLYSFTYKSNSICCSFFLTSNSFKIPATSLRASGFNCLSIK
mgnify:CR=1 FL=1